MGILTLRNKTSSKTLRISFLPRLGFRFTFDEAPTVRSAGANLKAGVTSNAVSTCFSLTSLKPKHFNKFLVDWQDTFMTCAPPPAVWEGFEAAKKSAQSKKRFTPRRKVAERQEELSSSSLPASAFWRLYARLFIFHTFFAFRSFLGRGLCLEDCCRTQQCLLWYVLVMVPFTGPLS
jgi:hypothetical protein